MLLLTLPLLYSARPNLGNAVGAWLGGLPIAAGYSYRYAAAPGVLLATAGLFMILHFRRLTKGKGGN